MGRIILTDKGLSLSAYTQLLIWKKTMTIKTKTFVPGMKFTETIKKPRISENDVESYLIKQVKATGGESHKWHARGRAGVHDRIVLFPGDEIWLVEVKASDGSKSPKQEEFHEHLYKDLAYTRSITVWCYKDVDDWLDIRHRWNSLTMTQTHLNRFKELQIGRIKR